MEENISRFVTAIIAIFILFIFPVYTAYEKKDDISYALAVRYTQEFVDNVRRKGYITQELYQDYAKSLIATGNTYSIELEHEYVRYDVDYVDGSNKSATRNTELFTNDHIINILDNGQVYTMNVNDNFNVKIKNTNVTLATVIYNIVTVNTSSNNVRIYVDYGGKILAEKWYEADLKYSEYGGITEKNPYNIELTATDIDFDKIVDDDLPGGIVDDDDTEVGDGIIDSTPQDNAILANYVKIGDYVAYYPYGAKEYSTTLGTDDSQTVYMKPGVKWRVLDVERGGKVTLISESNAIKAKDGSDRLSLFNKSVDSVPSLLNEVCNTLFKNDLFADNIRNLTKDDYDNLQSNVSSELFSPFWKKDGIRIALSSIGLTNTENCSVLDGEYYCWETNETAKAIYYIKPDSSLGLDYKLNSGRFGLIPVIQLKQDIQFNYASCNDSSNPCGTSSNPWQLLTTAATQTIYEVAEIGDYVGYEPTGSTQYTISKAYTGHNRDQTISRNNKISWRVLDKSNGKVILISDDVLTSDDMYFKSVVFGGGNLIDHWQGDYYEYDTGTMLYNNVVDILHDTCEKLYSRPGVAKARSLNLDDLVKYCGLDVSKVLPNYNYEIGAGETYPKRLDTSDYVSYNFSSVMKWQSERIGEYLSGDIKLAGDKTKKVAFRKIEDIKNTDSDYDKWRVNFASVSCYDSFARESEYNALPLKMKLITINKEGSGDSLLANSYSYFTQEKDLGTFYGFGALMLETYDGCPYYYGVKFTNGGGKIRPIVELDGDTLVNPSTVDGSSASKAIKLIY